MSYEHKPGTFSLFKNDRKGDNEKAPDYKGEGKDFEGNPVEVAAWLRDGSKGKFMSCSFKRKEGARQAPQQQRQPVIDDDSTPF